MCQMVTYNRLNNKGKCEKCFLKIAVRVTHKRCLFARGFTDSDLTGKKFFYFIYSKEQYYHLAYIHMWTTNLNWENFGVLND